MKQIRFLIICDLVKSIIGDVVTYYPSASYELRMGGTSETELKFYFAGSVRVALREDEAITWLLSDHLGSTSVTVDATGNLLSALKYTAYGELRSGTSTTDYQYTGQRNEIEIGLYFYVARMYDPQLARFISADTIIPEPVAVFASPSAARGRSIKGYDRYAYVNGNPISFNDPSGHKYCDTADGTCDGGGSGGGGNSGGGNSGGISGGIGNNPGGVPPYNIGQGSVNDYSVTITENAVKGDLKAILKLITPTHVGFRSEVFVCYFLGCIGGGSNYVHNFIDKNSAITIDYLGGISVSPGFMPKIGVFASVGPVIGWGSSRIENVTTGTSGQFSGVAAAGFGVELTESFPIEQRGEMIVPIVDPIYGQIPATLYLGFGAGLALGGSLGLDFVGTHKQIREGR